MVGAGLSLNAKPSPSAHKSFPTWSQLSRAMFDEIYPANSGRREEPDRPELFAGKTALRIASEYEATFGTQGLYAFLRKNVPDSTHEPGEIHRLLLQLPWKDAFTTNYDTLLERTEFTEKAYQVVTMAGDLSFAKSPRIIKLHGSFDSSTRFIITEEDYRTYPKRNAPFVNTVRQSLLENSLVLIGFSGDDPNFLEWIGWIRDELGNHHAPIYLISSVPLDSVGRSFLAQRGVTPVDLSPVVASETPPGDVHRLALEWFLLSLQAAKPQRPERWPHEKTVAQEIADFVPPILGGSEVEPEGPETNQNSFDESTVIKIFERWRFERRNYPGWLVPADHIRSELRRRTNQRFREFMNYSGVWPSADRILLFRELLWRVDTSMLPLDQKLIEPFESAVNDLMPAMGGKSSFEELNKLSNVAEVSIAEVPEAWLEVMFALLRDAREEFDSERWEKLSEKIDSVVTNRTQFTDRYLYEQALWLMWNLERDKTRELLKSWSPSIHYPRAVMWKAGLLAELGELEEARLLLRSLLRGIRGSLQSTQGENIGLLSSEGWCTFLLLAIESAGPWEGVFQGSRSSDEFAKLPELREEYLERWQELKVWDCDPWSTMEYFDMVLAAEPTFPRKEKQITYGFDPGRLEVRYSLFGASDTRWLSAFSYLRLYEQVGLPLRFSTDTLGNACKWLSPFVEFWSPTLLIRAGKVKDFRDHELLTRTKIGYMEEGLAKRMHNWAMNALVREVSNIGSTIPFQSPDTSLLEVLIEFLSRMTLRLETEDLEESFEIALALHRRPDFYAHVRLRESCGPWFRRLFLAANDKQLLSWLPDLLRFPLSLSNADSLNTGGFTWPDPLDEFPEDRASSVKETYPELHGLINDAIDWLLSRSREENEDIRRRAMRRSVGVLELMSEAQKQRLGALLWEKTRANGLPDVPDLYSFSYLHLPAPQNVDVVSKVREYLLNLQPRRAVSQTESSAAEIELGETEDRMVSEVARATKPVVQIPNESGGKIEWSLDEAKELWKKVFDWWENDKRPLENVEERSGFLWGEDTIKSRFEELDEFLGRVVLPKVESDNENEVNKLLEFLLETRQYGIYLTTALPYLLLHSLDEAGNVSSTILNDLTLGDERAAMKGAQAVRHWIHLADAGLVEDPPDALLNKLIDRVIFRQREGVGASLQNLALLLSEKPDTFSFEQVSLVVSSLVAWQSATFLPLSESAGDFPEAERPSLRCHLGRLASALGVWLENNFPGQPEPSEISLLRESFRTDPLPEVRRSVDQS